MPAQQNVYQLHPLGLAPLVPKQLPRIGDDRLHPQANGAGDVRLGAFTGGDPPGDVRLEVLGQGRRTCSRGTTTANDGTDESGSSSQLCWLVVSLAAGIRAGKDIAAPDSWKSVIRCRNGMRNEKKDSLCAAEVVLPNDAWPSAWFLRLVSIIGPLTAKSERCRRGGESADNWGKENGPVRRNAGGKGKNL